MESGKMIRWMEIWEDSKQLERVERLKNILVHMNQNPGSMLLDDGDRVFLSQAECTEVALAQERLLDKGLGADDLFDLWKRNRKLLPNQSMKLRMELEPGHVLERVLAEHEMILCFMSELWDVNKHIQKLDHGGSTTMEIRKLAHIAGHLVCSEQHCEREEEVIFPELRRHGFSELLMTVYKQHRKIRQAYSNLNRIVWQVDEYDFETFQEHLDKITSFLVPAMRAHVFTEDSIVFPLAIDIIDDPHVWDRIKEVCDQIGYCGYGS
jgi:hypothetical protein